MEILQTVLKQDPSNSAANHYWIHAVEASPHPEQALHSAEILGGLAPIMWSDGTGAEQVSHDNFNNWFPHLSPDGKWIAYIAFPPDVAPEK